MAQKQTAPETIGYNGIYLERSGVHARELAETLAKAPELPLSDAEKAEVYQFETVLLAHEVREGITIEDAIRRHKGEETTAPLFFAKASIDGAIDLPSLEEQHFADPHQTYQWWAEQIRQQAIPSADIRKAVKQSQEYYTRTMSERLLDDREPAEADYDAMPLVIEPEKFARSALDIQLARAAVLTMRGSYLRDTPNHVDAAKRSLIDVYLGKINSMVAGDIPIAEYMIDQARLIGDQEMEQAANGLVPDGLRSALHDNDMKQRVFRRLDYLRNGLGSDQDGRASSVDRSVRRVTVERGQETSVFTPEDVEKLKSHMLSPEQMQRIFSDILAKANLLSSEPSETWSPDRVGRAADELFQVVVNPTKSTFAVSGPSGVYKVPSRPRSLYDVLVVGGSHELTHIDQAQADRSLESSLKIAGMKGRRVSMLREAGANRQQRRFERQMFGVEKPISLTYARALQELEQGGTMFDAVRAFYNEKRAVDPTGDRQAMAVEAADRVLRLTRSGGLNSQPMVYAEESILADELEQSSPEISARATTVTSLDLVDQVKLHKYGLLPTGGQDAHEWSNYVLDVLSPYIDEAIHGSAANE